MNNISIEIDRIFKLQMDNKWKLRDSTSKDRIQKLLKLKESIMRHKEDIVKAIYKDFKKPEEEVLLTEIYPITSEIKHTIKHLSGWMSDKKIRAPIGYFGSKGRVRCEPKGISLIIAPWNYPFNLTMEPLVSAIAAGNCVMLKPSEFTPATTACIRQILNEIFDESEVAVFEGDAVVSGMLLAKPFDNIFFTGSPAVGKIVMEAAAKNLTTVTLELGGKSPVIIDVSADLEIAAKRVAWGKCLNAGQICVAPDYLLIPNEKKEEFIELLIKNIKSYYGVINEAVEKDKLKFSRIISKKHFLRIRNLIEEAIERGAKLEFGGYYDESDNLISPSILSDLPNDAKILEEEIFGPVLPIITYKTIDEAIKIVNSKPKPLALYIFGKDRRTIKRLLACTESGDAVVNDVVVHVGNTKLPFGGFNNSGIGKSHGYHGFMAFTHERSVLIQGKRSVLSMLYPPYKTNTKKLLEKIIKYF